MSGRWLPAESLRWAAVCTLALLLAACTPSGEEVFVPSLPDIPYDALESGVRAQFKAIDEALRAAPDAPRSAVENGRLGMLFHAYGWSEEADVCYRRAELLDGASRWSYYRARLAIDGGRPDAALVQLERALAGGGESLPTLLLLGDLALERSAPEEGRRWFARALELDSSSTHAHLGAGRAAADSGALEDAVSTFQNLLKQTPDFGVAHYHLALAYRSLGNTEAAARHLERYEKNRQTSAPPDPLMEEIHALRRDSNNRSRTASQLLKSGRLNEALTAYAEILKHDPDSTMARYNLALVLQRSNRHEEAIPHYEQFLAARPQSPDGHNNLGLALEELGRVDEAQISFEQAVAVRPEYFPAHVNIARLEERRGDADAALHFYGEAVRLRPERMESRLARSRVLTARGDPQAAVKELLAALEYAPDSEQVHEALLRHLAPAAAADTDGHVVFPSASRRRLAGLLRTERNFAAAIFSLRRSHAEHGDWRDAVALGWLLATCPVPALRRPHEALDLVAPVCAAEASNDPLALDTLAASYAGVGRFADARATAERALALATDSSRKGYAQRARRIALRLDLYRQEKAFVEQ